MSARILYVDAGGRSHGDISIGVADELGHLLEAKVMRDTLLNHAELSAVLLACDHIASERGVILTDSLTAAKSMGRDLGLHKLASRVDEYLALRDAIRERLPGGWNVAWIPRQRNLADAALESWIRSMDPVNVGGEAS